MMEKPVITGVLVVKEINKIWQDSDDECSDGGESVCDIGIENIGDGE